MSRLLGVLVLIIGGWAVWSYVLHPALQPPRPSASKPIAYPTATPTPQLGDQSGAVAARARDFLTAWEQRRYKDMYAALSPQAQQAITQTPFITRYQNIAAEATITGLQATITGQQTTGRTATVTYTVALSTTAVGTTAYTTTMPLRYENGAWGIDWSPNLIFPGLSTSTVKYLVHLYNEPAQRGQIVDRLGHPLAIEGQVIPIDVVPAYITDEKDLISFLSGWLHMPSKQLHDMIHVSWAQQHPTWLVPITTVTSVQWNSVPEDVRIKEQNNGLDVDTKSGASRRLYPDKGLAEPLLGYVNSTDGHGAAGLESWADKYLSGQDGAKLAIANAPDYQYIHSVIKERPVQDGATVHLTLDQTLQQAAQQALGNRPGAVVALRPSDGAVLAMASTPGFDPNAFAVGLSAQQAHDLFNNPNHPLINRATLGQYPLGSIFKLITAGAALEKGGYTINTQIPGPGVWYGLGPNFPMRDWLPQGHGIISLHEAIVQSCDTCFYQVGQKLDEIDHNLLPDYARSWGFGQPTGIVGVPEGAGVIPDPHWKLTTQGQPWYPGDAVNMAIGQGNVLVTPLQVAQMLAALGNNGVMYRPYVVSKITDPQGKVIKDYPPVVSRTLPLSAQHRQEILDAMLGVTTEAYGTAADTFGTFPWKVMGKTGTAQTGDGRNPDAWFAAIAPYDHPKIALIVLVEYSKGGEAAGAEVAAPIARQILQTFFTKDRDLAGTLPSSGPTTLHVP